ncbi:armadillo-type protein [Chytriomyces sp. MP71]|nr:armadillo-type protein [Chytriomyces sp. MP71]
MLHRDTLVPSFAPNTTSAVPDAIDFAKICAVFTGKHTSNMTDRHVAILEKLSRIYRDGFIRKDLHDIGRVLTLAYEKLEGGASTIAPALAKLIDIACHPFAMIQNESPPSDHMTYFAESLAKLTNTARVEIAVPAADAIYRISGGRTPLEHVKPAIRLSVRPLVHRQMLADQETRNKAEMEKQTYLVQIEESGVMVELMRTLEDQADAKIVQAVLKILQKFSYSNHCSKKLATEGHVAILIDVMYANHNEITTSAVSEIFWNLLQCKEKIAVAHIVVERGILNFRLTGSSLLKSIFDSLCRVKPGLHSVAALRNEYMVMLECIADLAPTAAESFHESGFTESVAGYMMGHELGGLQDLLGLSVGGLGEKVTRNMEHPLIGSYAFTGSNEDFEFKKILMQLSMQLCAHDGNLMLFIEAGLLEFLLLYLDLDVSNDGVDVWNDAQLEALQLQSIQFLNAIIPRIPQKWSAVNGNATLLSYLTAKINSPGSSSEVSGTKLLQPKSVDPHEEEPVGSGSAGLVSNPTSTLVGGTLRLLSRISELGPSQKRALGEQGAFKVLIAILADHTQRSDTWRAAFLICSSLCQGAKTNKTLFGQNGGVEMMLPFLTYSSADPKETEGVLIAAVECIWGSVCGNAINEMTFFSADGIFALMDLIPKASYILQRHILGCILDLLENPKARSHVLEWRSHEDEQKGVAHMLIHLWNVEETRLGVPAGPLGTLADEKKPLAGVNQTVPSKSCKDGYVVEEIAENLRAKIYAMFCKLGFESFYPIITAEEQIKLTLVAKYLDFKIGQVWEEISEELDHEGIRPISPDLDCINTAKQVIVEKARAIKNKQMDIVEKKSETERWEEGQFYNVYMKQRSIPVVDQ